MSTGFNAGIDTSDLELSYGEEVAWGTTPAVAFQALRVQSEGFTESKNRSRPPEIRSSGDAAHAVTQSVEASGSLTGSLSYDTYKDFMEGLLNGDWSTPISETSTVALDFVSDTSLANLTGQGFTYDGTNVNLDSLVAGQWIKVSGYTGGAVGLNGYYQVTAVDAPNNEVQVSATYGNGPNLIDAQDEGGGVTITGEFVRNGTSIHTYYVQKKLAAALFLCYPGSYISSGSISSSQGAFNEVSFDFLCKQQDKQTSDQSTGPVTAAPAGRVMDTVANFNQLEIDGAEETNVIQSIDWTVTKEGARAQYGVGSSAAQGMGRGTVTLAGSLTTYFSDFTLFDEYVNEVDKVITYRVEDNAGNAYIITLPAVTIMNPNIVAGGADQDILAEFDMEGNAAESGIYSGVTIQIDSFPA